MRHVNIHLPGGTDLRAFEVLKEFSRELAVTDTHLKYARAAVIVSTALAGYLGWELRSQRKKAQEEKEQREAEARRRYALAGWSQAFREAVESDSDQNKQSEKRRRNR